MSITGGIQHSCLRTLARDHTFRIIRYGLNSINSSACVTVRLLSSVSFGANGFKLVSAIKTNRRQSGRSGTFQTRVFLRSKNRTFTRHGRFSIFRLVHSVYE